MFRAVHRREPIACSRGILGRWGEPFCSSAPGTLIDFFRNTRTMEEPLDRQIFLQARQQESNRQVFSLWRILQYTGSGGMPWIVTHCSRQSVFWFHNRTGHRKQPKSQFWKSLWSCQSKPHGVLGEICLGVPAIHFTRFILFSCALFSFGKYLLQKHAEWTAWHWGRLRK